MPHRYAANTAALWTGLGRNHTEPLYDTPELLVLRDSRLVRVLPRRPLRRLPDPVAPLLGAGPGTVDDPFGTLHVPERAGLRSERRSVLVRESAPPRPGPAKADLEILAVTDREDLRVAERTIVHGGLPPDRWRDAWGRVLPEAASTLPGLRLWLARRQRTVAAVCGVHDDGATVGVPWLVVLPEQRGRGIGRLLLAHALADSPQRTAVAAVPAAAAAGYTALGFDAVSTARRHTWR